MDNSKITVKYIEGSCFTNDGRLVILESSDDMYKDKFDVFNFNPIKALINSCNEPANIFPFLKYVDDYPEKLTNVKDIVLSEIKLTKEEFDENRERKYDVGPEYMNSRRKTIMDEKVKKVMHDNTHLKELRKSQIEILNINIKRNDEIRLIASKRLQYLGEDVDDIYKDYRSRIYIAILNQHMNITDDICQLSISQLCQYECKEAIPIIEKCINNTYTENLSCYCCFTYIPKNIESLIIKTRSIVYKQFKLKL